MPRKETGSWINIESGTLKSCRVQNFQHCAATKSESHYYCKSISVIWPYSLDWAEKKCKRLSIDDSFWMQFIVLVVLNRSATANYHLATNKKTNRKEISCSTQRVSTEKRLAASSSGRKVKWIWPALFSIKKNQYKLCGIPQNLV